MLTQKHIKSIPKTLLVTFTYTNHKGITAKRTVYPQRMIFSDNYWYKIPQWLMICLCLDRQDIRYFALSGIKDWKVVKETK